ncbi:MAG TPA: serine kinase [bacterium]|nr:serine kinase [bacterium]HQI49326.1 serine kinase [bacterium]HQJ64698.1 serine kinase [bacterium]
MILKNVLEVLPLNLLTKSNPVEQPVVSACISDMLSDVMAKAPKDSLWITNQTHENVIAIAFFKELTAVIFANGVVPSVETIDKANKKQIALYSCEANAFDIAGRLYTLGLRGSH